MPFFYVFSRDRLAWVTLNGPEPLLDVVPPGSGWNHYTDKKSRHQLELELGIDNCDLSVSKYYEFTDGIQLHRV